MRPASREHVIAARAPEPRQGSFAEAPFHSEHRLSTGGAAGRLDQPEVPESNGPIIQVTIGKVEVRAVVAPERECATRARRAQTPVMTLDDYLSGRAARGGR
jgi:hypothetical protein